MAGNSAPAMPRSGGRAMSLLIVAVLAGAAMLLALLAMHATSGTLPAVSGDSSRSSDLSSGPAQSVPPVPSAETGMITEAAETGTITEVAETGTITEVAETGTITEAAVASLPIAAAAARILAMTAGSAGSAPECARCTPDCALVAMICALLLTVAALIGFGPVLRHQVARRAGVLVRRSVSPPPHIYRPSLTVLSISRT